MLVSSYQSIINRNVLCPVDMALYAKINASRLAGQYLGMLK